jgi:hypothetical protein
MRQRKPVRALRHVGHGENLHGIRPLGAGRAFTGVIYRRKDQHSNNRADTETLDPASRSNHAGRQFDTAATGLTFRNRMRSADGRTRT